MAPTHLTIAHSAVVTPHRAGLYETTRDLVAALRYLGHDARIIDPVNSSPPSGGTAGGDRGVPIAGPEFAAQADVICSHSGLSKAMNALDKPIVHFLHGRPASSFLLSQSGKVAVYPYLAQIRQDPRYKAFVTFWPESRFYWTTILPPAKIRQIPPPVDLELWTPRGPAGYGFHGHKAAINVVCASLWREDETPYHVINAFHAYARYHPEARLHLYAAPQKGAGWQVLKDQLQAKSMLGEVQGMVTGLANVYRAADVVITPHRIATRSVREALACGCNVVMARGNIHSIAYTPYRADPQDLQDYAYQIHHATITHARNRYVADNFFNPHDSAIQLTEIIKDVLNGRI
jgi:glycosyltransferase involved in cell wall biosynthesis